jgi:hypothetical protein
MSPRKNDVGGSSRFPATFCHDLLRQSTISRALARLVLCAPAWLANVVGNNSATAERRLAQVSLQSHIVFASPFDCGPNVLGAVVHCCSPLDRSRSSHWLLRECPVTRIGRSLGLPRNDWRSVLSFLSHLPHFASAHSAFTI